MILPYEVRTLTTRSPWANLGIMAATVLMFVAEITGFLPESAFESMVLTGWDPRGWIGSLFLHADFMHLFGNMVFLWVFGNALAGVMNQVVYCALYFALGILAGAIHLLMDGSPAIGASGAISGLLGVYLVLYPLNRIHCFYWILRPGTFDLPGYLLIIGWFLLEVFYAVRGSSEVAYWAHVGGLVAGILAGWILLQMNRIDIGDYDNPTAVDLLLNRRN